MKIMSSNRLPTNITGTITTELNMTNIRLKLRVCEGYICPWGRKGVERVKFKRYNKSDRPKKYGLFCITGYSQEARLPHYCQSHRERQEGIPIGIINLTEQD